MNPHKFSIFVEMWAEFWLLNEWLRYTLALSITTTLQIGRTGSALLQVLPGKLYHLRAVEGLGRHLNLPYQSLIEVKSRMRLSIRSKKPKEERNSGIGLDKMCHQSWSSSAIVDRAYRYIREALREEPKLAALFRPAFVNDTIIAKLTTTISVNYYKTTRAS